MIFNFGSINIDHVYRLSELPKPGETCIAKSYEKFLGGKGVNQSVAISKAQGELSHVGAVGRDGQWALDQIESLGVGTSQIATIDQSTGHAIIYVDDASENQIVIESGANQHLAENVVDTVLESANPDQDFVLLQNETNLADYIVTASKSLGLKTIYAAAPFVAEITIGLIDKIDLLAVNEGEAQALAEALKVEPSSLPVPQVLITKGSAGAEFHSNGEMIWQDAIKVDAIDSTGAGDAFLGSFLARYSLGDSIQSSLAYASVASAIQVTREGAAVAIPDYGEVLQFLKDRQNS